MLALALSGLCLCSPLRADEAEDKAVAFVKKLGGEVERDAKAPGKPVVAVHLWNTNVADVGLKNLAPLKDITWLNLSETKVTDAGLKELAALKDLQTLFLGGTKVTDGGLKELKQALPTCEIVK